MGYPSNTGFGGLKSHSSGDEVICRIEPTPYTDHVWVLIPPRLWKDKRLAKLIALAIEKTFEEKQK
jgi:hypothetical protein